MSKQTRTGIKAATMADSLLAARRGPAHDEVVPRLIAIRGDAEFLVEAGKAVAAFRRATVLSALGIGEILAAVKARLPGRYGEWLSKNDIPHRTASRYTIFALHADRIRRCVPLQSLEFNKLTELLALGRARLDDLCSGGKVAGKSLSELAAMPVENVVSLLRQFNIKKATGARRIAGRSVVRVRLSGFRREARSIERFTRTHVPKTAAERKSMHEVASDLESLAKQLRQRAGGAR